ncbi:MAG: hypothetical protein IKV85_04580, partial [Ruminococcus sp.]|nr:hypothetical protein [Ruminococcus sp.]
DTEVSVGYTYPIDTLSDKTTEQEDKPKRKKFVKPSVDDVLAYCRERSNQVDPQRFYDYYESNGWKVGKNPMKDWKAAVRTWERNDYSGNSGGSDLFDVRNQYWDENDPTVH